MSYIIDRFEGRFAVLEAENGEFIGVERARLPADAAEGDVLLHRMGEFAIDKRATEARRAEMRAKLRRLWKEAPEQD